MEITDVNRFFSTTIPFCYLDESVRASLLKSVTVYYCPAHRELELANDRLLIVRSGVFVTTDNNAEYLREGDCFGYQALINNKDGLRNNNRTEKLQCEEDGLVYWLTAAAFLACYKENPPFAGYFQGLSRRNLHQYREPQTHSRVTLKVEHIVRPLKVVITPDKTVMEAASLMTTKRVSSLLVEQDGSLMGIITDRDLRSRVVAQGLPATTQVQEIMTHSPYCIDKGAYMFEAVQTMSRHNIHHLPVTDRGHSYGMITLTDIVRAQQSHPVYLIGDIHRQTNVPGLRDSAAQLRPLLQKLAQQQVPAHEISHIITTVTDALTQRLIHLAQQQWGEPPCAFSWLAFGSQARMDQSINADQDNALLLAEEPEGEIARYFEQLAQWVCQGLAQCGIALCPGNIMATNTELRLSLQGWMRKFIGFIQHPDPKSVLGSSIFFDLRCIAGDAALTEQLHQHVLQKSRNNELFLFHMARTALERTPPLGMLRNFVLEQNAEGEKGVDLKKRGLSLITDLVRIFALAQGINEVNTHRRLQKLMEEGSLEYHDGKNLQDAFSVLAQLRWQKHQQHLLQEHHQINNLLNPDDLHILQRNQLKDSFNVIREAQALVQRRFCRPL